jgi:nicotinate-nucleotide adenylyltransferase
VHLGHLHVARAAQRVFNLERVLFVPAARPPHKPDAVLAGARDRVAMLELALADEPTFQVESLELGREGPSYTLDTVHELEKQGLAGRGLGALHLILGTDNLEGLPKWYGAEELLRNVVPVIVPRSASFTWPASLDSLPDDLAARVRSGWVDVPPVPGASRDIREQLAAGSGEAWSHLSLAVATYVRRRGLYGCGGDA